MLKEVRKHINPYKKEWINTRDTNCYLYALGLDVKPSQFDNMFRFYPGTFIGETLGATFTTEKLLSNLEGDLKTLGIDYIEVNPKYIINRINGEWKIAVMVTRENKPEHTDFHFLRQTEKGIWYHKDGFKGKPTDIDSYHRRIVDPSKAIIDDSGFYTKHIYEYVKTYCLRKVNKNI